MKNEEKLSEQQRQNIIKEWNSRPDNPPSLLELIKIAFPSQNVDGRSKEGKMVKAFLATNQIEARAAHKYKAVKKITLSNEDKELIKTTQEALYLGIKEAVPGNYVSDIGHAIQAFVEPKGYSIVRELVGHGIGTNLHEDPQVPNYGDPGMGIVLKEGMCLAIEPMINRGGREVYTLDDGWTVKTKDGYNSAHFEHTIAIRKNGPVVLSGSRLNG